MMKNIILFFVFTLILRDSKSQGCSDAGFCSVGTLQSEQFNQTALKNNFKFTATYGQGEQGTTVFQTIPEFEFSFFKNNSLQLKVPFVFINGNLGKHNGIGDVVLATTQTLWKSEKIKFNITVGTKIATGKSDVTTNNLPLPMPYQTSLGTTDIILGTSLQYKKWTFGVGVQCVVINKNENRFLHSAYTSNIDSKKYFESNFLERGNDALARFEKNFKLKKTTLSAGLVGIYHLQESSLVDNSGRRIAVKNSDGLTLNITGKAQYNFSKYIGINLSLGFPIIVRKVRPDGLTRHFVVATAFNYNFGK